MFDNTKAPTGAKIVPGLKKTKKVAPKKSVVSEIEAGTVKSNINIFEGKINEADQPEQDPSELSVKQKIKLFKKKSQPAKK